MKTLFTNVLMMLILCLASNVLPAQAVSVTEDKTEVKKKVPADKDALIKKYPWVKQHLEDKSNSPLQVSEMLSENSHYFVMIETEQNKVLYSIEGKAYCTNSASLDCDEFYKLSPGDLEWKKS